MAISSTFGFPSTRDRAMSDAEAPLVRGLHVRARQDPHQRGAGDGDGVPLPRLPEAHERTVLALADAAGIGFASA